MKVKFKHTLNEHPAHCQKNQQGIRTGEHVVEHHAPSVAETFHFPASERFGDVDDAEQGEPEERQYGGGELVAGYCGHNQWNPCAYELIDYNCARVFPPVFSITLDVQAPTTVVTTIRPMVIHRRAEDDTNR